MICLTYITSMFVPLWRLQAKRMGQSYVLRQLIRLNLADVTKDMTIVKIQHGDQQTQYCKKNR